MGGGLYDGISLMAAALKDSPWGDFDLKGIGEALAGLKRQAEFRANSLMRSARSRLVNQRDLHPFLILSTTISAAFVRNSCSYEIARTKATPMKAAKRPAITEPAA